MSKKINRTGSALVFIITGIFVVGVLPTLAQIDKEEYVPQAFHLFPGADSLPVYGYTIINEFDHDSSAFTQGLIYEHDALYEGTGLYGSSSLRKVELETGTVLKIRNLDNSYFGEGITMWNDTIIQLTWQSHIGLLYIEQDTFQLIDSFSYSTEGWGLTHDDTCLIMSDGTPRIHYLDPHTYVEVGYIDVNAEGTPVTHLNELEYIQGKIYANVWYCDSIAIIEPLTGDVTGWLNLSGILTDHDISFQANVLNGIAYDHQDVRLFVTGKLWPTLFEIEVDPINYPPEIIASSPPSPCYIITDSILLLEVLAQDPDPEDSLLYIWSIDGVVDTSAHDTCYLYSSSTVTTDTIMVRVDDGMFYDSLMWVVVVSDPGAVNESIWESQAWMFLYSYPNPFSKLINISFGIGYGAEGVELMIYDASGRMVRDFSLPTAYSSVPTTIKWSGTDRFDRPVPAGVYFIRLQIGNSQIIHKIILVH
jgi:glutamine cyclotransferase